jgi:uncharacterized membrane protein YedE/YeeE
MNAITTALLGGALIGLGASLLWLANGRIAGAAGLLNSALSATPAGSVARAFVAGLLISGAALHLVAPERFSMAGTASLPVLAVAGLLVGFGTRLGSGCTSGHGVCGIARGSKRSIAATLVFMTAAAITVYFVRHGS